MAMRKEPYAVTLKKVHFVDIPEMELTQYTISKMEQRLIDMRVLN